MSLSATEHRVPYGRREVIKLFEDLARTTWELLATGREVHCVPSEETLTDLNLLHLARARLPFLSVYKASKQLEGRCGFDWEWWIGNDRSGWLRYVVQAKKMNLRTLSYTGLRQRVKGELQLEVLRDFARSQGAIPLYCLYNFIDEQESSGRSYWNCSKDFELEQLGCTLVLLDVVERELAHRSSPGLIALHAGSEGRAIPWRCLFSCARRHLPLQYSEHSPFPLQGMAGRLLWRRRYPDTKIYRRAPSGGLTGERDRSLYTSDLGGFPKRIMVLDSHRMEGGE